MNKVKELGTVMSILIDEIEKYEKVNPEFYLKMQIESNKNQVALYFEVGDYETQEFVFNVEKIIRQNKIWFDVATIYGQDPHYREWSLDDSLHFTD
jgi:hypothetical protein